MNRRFYTGLLFAGCLFPLALTAQKISLHKLLSLQKSSLINIQDNIETSTWKLKGITSLREVDSSVFQSRISHQLDSLSHLHAAGETTPLNAPAWIEYLSQIDTRISPTTIFNNMFTITLPRFFLLNAINLQLKGYDKHAFHHALRISFADEDTYKFYLNEIDVLALAKEKSYVLHDAPLTTRVYKLNDQVINLTTFDQPHQRSFCLSVYARTDYDFLHAGE